MQPLKRGSRRPTTGAMAFSLEAATLATQRTVCDLCGAVSSAPRGTSCKTCAVGTMRWRSELQVRREQRSAARREARAQQLRR